MKIKIEIECWREVVTNHFDCDGLSDAKVDELADQLCENVIGVLRRNGWEVYRAYGQKVGAFEIIQQATAEERAAFDAALDASLENLRNEIIVKIKTAIKDMDTSSFYPYDGEYEIPLGEVVYDPEEGVFAYRQAEEDWPFSCGFECCGVAEYAKVVVPLKILNQ